MKNLHVFVHIYLCNVICFHSSFFIKFGSLDFFSLLVFIFLNRASSYFKIFCIFYFHSTKSVSSTFERAIFLISLLSRYIKYPEIFSWNSSFMNFKKNPSSLTVLQFINSSLNWLHCFLCPPFLNSDPFGEHIFFYLLPRTVSH